MSLDHRIVLGHRMDAATTAALTLVDRRATERIVKTLDWEHDEAKRKQIVDDALGRLSEGDRDFAEAVLNGASWREMGISKQLFSWRLKKVEKNFRRINTR